jgi:hypothetical protein
VADAATAAILDEWNRAEHDAGCPGDEKYCALHCPVPFWQNAGIDTLAAAAGTAVESLIAAREQAAAVLALDAVESRVRALKRVGDPATHETVVQVVLTIVAGERADRIEGGGQ